MEKLLEDLAKEIRHRELKKLGWQFMMTGPNEFQYLKFDEDKRVAQQGDAVWKEDNANL